MEKKKKDGKEIRPGYKRTGLANQVFDEYIEKDLACRKSASDVVK